MATDTEAKDHSWLCSILVSASSALPVYETLFLHKDEVTLWVVPNAAHGAVTRKSPQEEGIFTLADALNALKSRHDRDSPATAFSCSAIIKGVRVSIDEEKLQELSSPRGSLGRCTALQPAFDRSAVCTVYVLRLEDHTDSYEAHFWHKRKGLLHPATNDRLYYKLLVLSKIILSAVHAVKRRKVTCLELEFLTNAKGEIWLIDTGECSLLSCTSPKTVPATPHPHKASDLCKPRRELKFFSSLRISTPEQLLRDSTSLSKDTPVTAPPLPASADANESKLTGFPSSVSSKDQLTLSQLAMAAVRSGRNSPSRLGPFANPHFKELIARAYARKQHKVADNLEQLFGDLERKLMAEDERLPSPTLSTKTRHSGALGYSRRDDPTPPVFEIRPIDPPKLPQPVLFPASAQPTPAPSPRLRTRIKRPAAQSQGSSSLLKLIDKYRSDKHFAPLQLKFSTRSQSIPARKYLFRKVSLAV